MAATTTRQPLLISGLLAHAERHHGHREIVSRLAGGDLHRCTYRDLAARARRLANALVMHGVGVSDRVASLAWNSHRHLELCHAVAGSGAVLHALSPELRPDQLLWMLRHADDRMLFFDVAFLPLVEAVAPQLPPTLPLVAMTDPAHMPFSVAGPRLLCHEDLVAQHGPRFTWPALDEDSPSSLCYVQDGPGDPTGVLQSHRTTMLQAYAAAQPDAFGCSATDTILPAVPMSHGAAWGLPHVACMVGAKIVFPGPWVGGPSLHELIEAEGVTLAAALPGAWQALFEHVEARGLDLAKLRRMVVGGASCPLPSIAQSGAYRAGGHVIHAWGATETSAAGTVCALDPGHLVLGADRRLTLLPQPGHAAFGIEMKVVGEGGRELPRDGVSCGALLVRGPSVAAGYYRPEGGEAAAPADGWMPTGEVAVIDPQGGVHLRPAGPS